MWGIYWTQNLLLCTSLDHKSKSNLAVLLISTAHVSIAQCLLLSVVLWGNFLQTKRNYKLFDKHLANEYKKLVHFETRVFDCFGVFMFLSQCKDRGVFYHWTIFNQHLHSHFSFTICQVTWWWQHFLLAVCPQLNWRDEWKCCIFFLPVEQIFFKLSYNPTPFSYCSTKSCGYFQPVFFQMNQTIRNVPIEMPVFEMSRNSELLRCHCIKCPESLPMCPDFWKIT